MISALRIAPLAVRRPLSTFAARTTLTRPTLTPRLALQSHPRFVANVVSGRPGSQSYEHAKTNVKEELGNSASDWARTIAGGVFNVDSVQPKKDSFLGITTAVATSVPTPYLVMGLAGGLPYVASAATTIYLAHQAGLAAFGAIPNIDPGVAATVLDQALNFQVTYGAVMLSFLGALHWGMEFSGLGGYKGYSRLMLGAAPILIAWPTLALQPTTALIWQWGGFTALWYADNKATAAGWTPKWYSQYRFYLSILVGSCIIGSLAGTSYWGPVGGHGLLSHDLNMIRAERKENVPERSGFVGGDIEAVPAGENADAYIMIRKKKNGGESEGQSGNEQ